jgi:uncharacterized protein YgbK (DUF1537 family)
MRKPLPLVAIIADDLTGALDAAAPFAMRRQRTVVATAPARLPAALSAAPAVIAVSTNSRESSSEEAVRVVHAVADSLRDTPIVFKKVDSRLKGHVRLEATALAQQRGLSSILLCPAIPEFGRHIRCGELTGFGVDAPVNCAALVGPGDMPVAIADASTEAELDALVAATLGHGGQLLAGARGLAGALARRLSGVPEPSRTTPRLGLPVAMAVGSRDPITVAQVAELRRARPGVATVSAPNGRFEGESPRTELVVLQATPGEAAADPAAVQEAFAASFVPKFTHDRRTLVLTGGATAAAVLERLDAGVLELWAEAAPGVPISRVSGNQDRPDIVTKSGGFGSARTLLDIVELCTTDS